MTLFSAAQFTKTSIPEVDRRMSRAGVAQLAVSRRGYCFVDSASRSLRGAKKKHPTAVILGISVSIRVPARIPLVSLFVEVREAAGLAFSRLHFGGFAPRASRVSAGRLGGKSRFFST